MTIKIPLEVVTKGIQQTVADFQNMQRALGDISKEKAGMEALAKSMGSSYREAKTLAKSLEMTADEVVAVVQGMKELAAVGANSATQFQVLSSKLGITVEQFEAISTAMNATKGSVAATVQGYMSLANAMGTSYDEAEKFAQTLGMTADEAKQAVVQLRELQQAGVNSNTQFRVLEETLGVTAEQFKKLEKAAANANTNQENFASRATKGIGAVGKGFGGVVSGAAGAAFAFTNIVSALGMVQQAGQQAYGLLIGQNLQLQQQLLGTQATLAATNQVIVNGAKIEDPTAAIQALEGPVKDAIGRIRQGSLELVGVTSNDIVPLFQIIAGQSAQIGASLDSSADLSLSFGAALQTLSIPLDQARQEINSILTGQINSDSQLAKSLGLTNEMVNQWKAQGTFVENVNQKLAAFRAGNALASKTIEGQASNIQEVFDEVARIAGEPLMEPIVNQLSAMYNYLAANKDAIIEFAKGASEQFVVWVGTIGESVAQIGQALIPAIKAVGPLAMDLIGTVGQGLQSLMAAAAQLATALGPAVEVAVQIAAKIMDAVRAAQAAMGMLTGGFGDSTEALEATGRSVASLASESIGLEGKLRAAIALTNQAKQEGRELTAEEKQQIAGLGSQRDSLIASMEQEMAALNAMVPIGEENARNLQAQKDELKGRIDALKADTLALGDNAKNVKLVADANQQAKQQLEGVQQGLKQGTTDPAEARKTLEAIMNNAEVEKATRMEAAEEITKIIQNKAKEEEAILEGQLSKGVISREQYNKKLTDTQLAANSDEIKHLESQLKTLAATDEAGRRAINAKLGEAYKKRADIQRQAYQRDLELIDERNDKALDAAKLAETQRDIEIAKMRKSGQFSEGELAQKEIESKIKNIDAELEAERKKYEELKKLKPATEEDRAKQEDQLRASQQKMAELTLSRVNQEIAAEENLRKQAIAAIKEKQQKAKLATDATVRGIREQVGELNKQNHAQEMILKSLDREQKLRESAAALVSAQMQAEISRYNAQIEALNTAIGLVKEAREAEDTQSEGKLKILDEEKQKLDEINEAITGDKAAREYELKMKYAPDARDDEKEAAEKRKKFEEENQKLQKEFQDEYAQTELVNAEAARKLAEQQRQTQRDIAEEKKREEEAAKARQQQLLAALGLAGKTEVELIQRKQQLEDQQAAAKAKAQQAEMALARQQMDMNTRRMAVEARMQLIAAKRAELEAKISVEKAKQAVTDAKAELAQAKLIQDPKERKAAEADAKSKIKDAELDLKLTKDEYAAAQDNTKFATQNIEDTKVLAAQQKATLEIQQQSANEVARQEEGLRTMNQALELSKAGAEGFAGALDKAAKSAELIQQSLGTKPAAPQARRLGGSVRAGEPYLVGEAGPELITPSRNGWVFTAKQTAKILADVQPANAAALPTGTISQIVAFRRDAAMLEELKKLRGQVEGMRPVQERNTFNLNSNQLVADAAELHLKIARNRLRRSRR